MTFKSSNLIIASGADLKNHRVCARAAEDLQSYPKVHGEYHRIHRTSLITANAWIIHVL